MIHEELTRLLEAANARWEAMSDADKEKLLRVQRRNYVLAEVAMGNDAEEQRYRAAMAAGDTKAIEEMDRLAGQRVTAAQEWLDAEGL